MWNLTFTQFMYNKTLKTKIDKDKFPIDKICMNYYPRGIKDSTNLINSEK